MCTKVYPLNGDSEFLTDTPVKLTIQAAFQKNIAASFQR